MRRRIAALLLGVAALATTVAGQEAALAEEAKSDQQRYEWQLRTGSQATAGTDANIGLHVTGSDGQSGPWNYTGAGALLSANQLDTFYFDSATELGGIERVCLSRDNSGAGPSWYVRYVTMGGETFTFNRWIPADIWICSPS